MAYVFKPIDEDDELTPVEDVSVPGIGPKNVYKNGRAQPQTSETETLTIPSAAEFTLPKVVDEGTEFESSAGL